METASPLEWLLFVVIGSASVVYVWLLSDAVRYLDRAMDNKKDYPGYDRTSTIIAGHNRLWDSIILALVQVIYLVMVITLMVTVPYAPPGPQPPTTKAGLVVRCGLLLTELLLVLLGFRRRRGETVLKRSVDR